MNAYSEDLRKKIVEVVQRGMPKSQAARVFGVGISTVKRYVATYREGRSLALRRNAPAPNQSWTKGRGSSWRQPRGASGGDPAPKMRVLAAGTRGFGKRLHGFQDTQAHGLDPKKRSVDASERDEWLRAAWRALVARGLATRIGSYS